LQAILATALWLLASAGALALEPKAPKISLAAVDWETARAALNDNEAARRLSASADAGATAPDPLARLNQMAGAVFPNIAASPVPVLLPFNLDAFLGHKLGDDADYLAGFGVPQFFVAGPAGYSAGFSVPLDTSSKLRTVDIDISGFRLLYELEKRMGGEEKPLAGVPAEFAGMRRFYFESHMRYLFTRHGVLYAVSAECYDGSVHSIRRLSCQDAHGVILRFLKALNIAGGMPQTLAAAAAPPERARPTERSAAFSYYPPGALISGTGARKLGGDADHTVYAAIRFPLADGPVQTYSQVFINLGDCTATPGDTRVLRRNGKSFRCLPGKTTAAADMPNGGQNLYPWRDNFCESRAYFVGQCPSGFGHQGEDIVPVGCAWSSRDSDQCERANHRLVAVHDGVILRAPRQEGLVIVANAPAISMRFRYLHMNPKAVDEGGFFSGRTVREGDVIGKVSNFEGRLAGTSYHLHFDIQVPTQDGWVLVNPYMTLVSAYERLIGSRGTELEEDLTQAAPADITEAVAIPSEYSSAKKSPDKNARKKRMAARWKHKKSR
jgi:hypothetical protein